MKKVKTIKISNGHTKYITDDVYDFTDLLYILSVYDCYKTESLKHLIKYDLLSIERIVDIINKAEEIQSKVNDKKLDISIQRYVEKELLGE